MPEEKNIRKPGRPRRFLRFCRRSFLVVLLAGVGVLVYLNTVGLPGVLKRPLVDALDARGVHLEFSRLRWRWHEGFVAENLTLRRQDGKGGPEFRSARAAVRLDMNQLLRLTWRIESVAVQDGNFSWTVPVDTEAASFQVTDIDADLGVDSDGSFDLRQFSSRFKGLQMKVDGTFGHPEALALKPDSKSVPANLKKLNQTLSRIANFLTNFEFAAQPTLKLHFRADAAKWSSLRADLDLQLPEARTTWGSGRDLRVHARVRPPSATNAEPLCTIQLRGLSLTTRWGVLQDWRAETLTVPVVQLPLNSSNVVTLDFARLMTRWGTIREGTVHLSARALDASRPDEIDLNWNLSGLHVESSRGFAGPVNLVSSCTINRTNALPLRGTHELRVRSVSSTNFSAQSLAVKITQMPPSPDRPAPDESWGFWRHLQPYRFRFDVGGEAVSAGGVTVDSVNIAGSWSAPALTIDDLQGTLYDGQARLNASIDVPSREIQAAAEVGFDFHKLDPVFTERFRNWFAPYQWKGTPRAMVTGKLRWPDWRNLKPDWREEVVPELGISGQFHVDNAFYKGIPGLEAYSDFQFTNFIWHLPNLTVVRPEGRAVARYDGDERTRDYVWQLAGEIDPHALKPLFTGNELRAFESFTNHATPHVAGTIWGRWRDHDRIGFRADINAPRLEIRGEQTDLVTATVEYTNRFLTIRNLEIQQSNQVGRAEALGIDLPGDRMYFTNVDCKLPPNSVARAIGPVTARAVAPYMFDQPPRIQVHGVLGLKGHDSTDLEFLVDGGPFHWWRFNLEQIQGDLHWRSNHLDLADMASRFYGGQAGGSASFQFFTNTRPTEFAFGATVTNAQLQPLVRDVFAKTNGLEGALSGAVTVTSARADSLDTWQGAGNMHLRDGIVWDIPIFGIFSPVFNAISPGLGQSRADEAMATFTMVNGTIISRDLQVRSTELSMGYQGSVDFMGNVEARMQARILKDSGVLGPLISAALWPLTKIFEYRLSGTLSQPVAEPIHIPKFLFMALEPFKALQGVLRGVGNVVTPKPPPPEPAKP